MKPKLQAGGNIAEDMSLEKQDGDNKEEELESMDCNDKQTDWKAGRSERSRLGVERSRLATGEHRGRLRLMIRTRT